jgi:hypothetical protein
MLLERNTSRYIIQDHPVFSTGIKTSVISCDYLGLRESARRLGTTHATVIDRLKKNLYPYVTVNEKRFIPEWFFNLNEQSKKEYAAYKVRVIQKDNKEVLRETVVFSESEVLKYINHTQENFIVETEKIKIPKEKVKIERDERIMFWDTDILFCAYLPEYNRTAVCLKNDNGKTLLVRLEIDKKHWKKFTEKLSDKNNLTNLAEKLKKSRESNETGLIVLC